MRRSISISMSQSMLMSMPRSMSQSMLILTVPQPSLTSRSQSLLSHEEVELGLKTEEIDIIVNDYYNRLREANDNPSTIYSQ